MSHNPALRLVTKCVVTVGIILTLLLAGGAPSGNTHSVTIAPDSTLVGQ